MPEFAHQALDGCPGERGQHLAEIGQRCPGIRIVAEVLQQQFLVRLVIEPAFAGIGPPFSNGGVEIAGKVVARAPPTALGFDHSGIDEPGKTLAHGLRERLLPGDGIQREKIVSREAPQPFLPHHAPRRAAAGEFVGKIFGLVGCEIHAVTRSTSAAAIPAHSDPDGKPDLWGR